MKEKQKEININKNELTGTKGLHKQIEISRKNIYKQQKEFNTTREIYKLDYQKMKLLIEKLQDKLNEYKAKEIRLQKENEELENKKRHKELKA